MILPEIEVSLGCLKLNCEGDIHLKISSVRCRWIIREIGES